MFSKTPYLTLVLPMFNEEVVVGDVLRSVHTHMAADLPHISFEILVIDDGSTDNSVAIVEGLQLSGLRLIQHPYNIGNGGAVKTGIRNARGEYILFMDADGQHQPKEIAQFLDYIDRYDLVIGARSSASDTAVHRNLANSIYNLIASYVSGFRIQDLTSGFRIIRADLAKRIAYLLPNTFSYPTTMTLAVVRGGYSLKYIPIAVKKRVGKSKIKLIRDGSRFLMIILKIATFYSPLKIFVPASVLMFLLGFGYGLFKVLVLDLPYGPTSAMLMTMSALVFLVGLVSEQVAQMRFDRSEREIGFTSHDK